MEEISETVGTRKIETISISAGIGFVNQAEKFGRELSGKQYEKYIVLHKGDFSYNKGNSNIYPQGCIYRLNNRTEAAVPNVFESFRVSVGNPDYYEQLFLSGFLNRQLYSKINRGVRDNGLLNLKGKDFYSCEVPYPPLAEQERIAEILIQCDRVIELKEQKLDELKQLKKEFLRKMFPAKGCDTPEIRFPRFTGAWEQRKLGEVIRLNGRIGFRGYTEKDIVSKDDGGILTFSPTNIVDNKLTTNCKNTYITRFKYDESPEIKIHNGDILFVKTGSTLGKSALVTGLSEDATLNPQVVVMRTYNLNAEFLAAMLVTNTIISQVNSAKIGGAVPTLTETRIKDFDVAIPVSEAEKEQIGKFFGQLDRLITLHQRELEKTKTYKKTLAKLLLTGIVRVQG